MAASLAFLSLLAALVQVVRGQVEQAHLRQAQYNAAQIALSNCSASYSGAARRQCIEQVNASLTPYSTYTPETEMQANVQLPQISQLAAQGEASMPATPNAQGFMQAAFARQ
ncbi:hypothetical protein [Polaromonas hydrogenivorans]|uniref:Uncharacterized protein n=1 Tax=Polaromonas hydrogenivorans TaxID=335476 RepID=A0AAU7LQL7_9BURK